MFDLIKRDLIKIMGKCSLRSFLIAYEKRSPYSFQFWWRLCSYFTNKKLHILKEVTYLIMQHYRWKFGVHLSIHTDVGGVRDKAWGLCLYKCKSR